MSPPRRQFNVSSRCGCRARFPTFLSVSKINVSFSVIGAIVAEFVQADRGLGFVIMTTYRTLNMPRLWAALIISALIGMVFFAIVSLIERLTIPWHSSMRVEP
jgi:NitT/TauT family transport system permease protein